MSYTCQIIKSTFFQSTKQSILVTNSSLTIAKARMILSDGREINLTKNSGLFFLKVTYQNLVNISTCNKTKQSIIGDIDLWHKRLGHLNKADVKHILLVVKATQRILVKHVQWASKHESQPVPKKVENKAKKMSIQTFSVLSKLLV